MSSRPIVNGDHGGSTSTKYNLLMALSALGVVYGDIGTSPLYALKESFHHGHNIALNQMNIFGILSLIFWSLIIVISIKYLRFILKADNKGEGGILALTALIAPNENDIHPVESKFFSKRQIMILFGLFGTALLYGDGMITPAISVLSAVEGLELITPAFNDYIVLITVGILVLLFSVQRFGTSVVGKIFGPVTLFWFLVLGSLGIYHIIQSPSVLMAANPYYAFHFFLDNELKGFLVLGSVFLVVTGGEALYSDLGHFGRRPIQLAWFIVVLPCLLLNYFGQGALIMQNPEAIKNPFFLMAPNWMLTPLVILATLATVIASQALITGVFSITMHAVHLGYIPRLTIQHTSNKEYGQIYVKSMNLVLMLACILLVVIFKTSTNLAAAYGIAVTITMAITTILFYVVSQDLWKWAKWQSVGLCSFLLLIDLSFFGANLVKVIDGGWVPLLVGISIFTLMTTWKRGRKLLALRNSQKTFKLNEFIESTHRNILVDNKQRLLPGTAIYMTSTLEFAPLALVSTVEHFKNFHETLIFLCVKTKETPVVEKAQRIEMIPLRENVYGLIIHYGFMDVPNIPDEIHNLMIGNIRIDAHKVSYFLGKENLFASAIPGMAIWRERIFSFMATNSQDATTYFGIPKNRVMEIGIQLEL